MLAPATNSASPLTASSPAPLAPSAGLPAGSDESTTAPVSLRRWPVGSRGAIVHALILTALLPIGSIGLYLLIGPYLPVPDRHPYDGSLGAFARDGARAVLGIGLFTGVCLLAVGRLRWRDLGWGKPTGRDVIRGVAGFAVTALAFFGLLAVATDITVAEIWAYMRDLSPSQRLQFMLIGVTASVVEESLFRGYMQPSLCKRLGRAGGIGVTALLFSVMHLPGNIVSFLGRLVLGLGMGITRGSAERASLWPAVIVHTLIWVVIGAL